MSRSAAIDKRLLALDALLHEERPKSALERLVIQRQITDLENEGKNGLIWNEAEAVRVIEFAKLHQHWKGPMKGKPFIPEPWQEHLCFAPLFGWQVEREGQLRRRFRLAYWQKNRKTGKTFACSVIANQGLLADREEGAEVYPFACDKNQATRVFSDCQATIRASRVLSQYSKVFTHHITSPLNNGIMRPVASKEGPLHGLNPSRAIADELHAHANRDAWDTITSGMGARLQPLCVAITTAGHDRSTICWEQREYARNVLEGHYKDETFHAFIACAEEEDDPFDPVTWWKANPNLGISIFRDFLADEANAAKTSAAKENKFRRLYLGQWTQQSVRWLPMHAWDACKEEFDERDLREYEAYAAIDLASTRDTNALAIVFRCPDNEFKLLVWYWIPEEADNQRAEQDRRQLMNWAGQGHIRLTHGSVADFDGQIPEDIAEIISRFNVQSVAYDRHGNAEAVVQKMVNMGIPHDLFVKFPQTIMNFTGPANEFERLVSSRKLKHNGCPVTRWQASNVSVKQDSSGNIRPDKEKSADKIDGIVAAIMAIGEAKFSQRESNEFFFEVVSA